MNEEQVETKVCAKITLEILYLIRKDYLNGRSSESIVNKCLQMIPILEEMSESSIKQKILN